MEIRIVSREFFFELDYYILAECYKGRWPEIFLKNFFKFDKNKLFSE